MALAFFDTNVLIYSVSDDVVKADRAERALVAGGWISVQVLNESTHVLRRKYKREWPDIRLFIERASAALEIAAVNLETHRLGLEIAERYNTGIYDSMIIAAALQCDCGTLYSEDMHHGLAIDSRLTIVNPFQT